MYSKNSYIKNPNSYVKGGLNKMTDIETIKDNVSSPSKKLSSLNIDSVFLEQDGILNKVFYSEEILRELRSCSKLLVAMAIGIAIDKGMVKLDTFIYPSIKDIVDIKQIYSFSDSLISLNHIYLNFHVF